MSISFDFNDLFYIESNLIGERVSLFDLAVWKNGLAFKNIDFSTTGKPVIKIAELNNGISNNTAYTDKEYSDDVSLTYGDLVFSWSGNPQTSIDIYKYILPDGWLNQHIFKVTPSSKVDKDFLFYVMKYLKPNFTKIATNKQTTGLGHVTLSDIKRISLILPTPYVQKQISAILSSIDNKIELNQQQNNNLEQQAQTLYLDKVEKYKDKEIKVEDIVVTANTGADAIQKAPIVDYDTGVKCVRVGDMSNKRSHHDWGYTKVSDEVFTQYQLKKDDIIVTRTASLGLNTIISKDLNAVYNNGLIRLSINKEKIIPLLVYRQFQTTDFENYISKIEGETSVRPNMKINYLLQYNFSIINKEKQEELVNILKPIWERQEQLK